MAVREWLTRTFGAKASIIGLAPDELPDRPLEKGFDDERLLTTYRDDAWPYILANKGGEQASQAPLVVGRMVTKTKGKAPEFEKVGPDHPVQQLFDSPNPLMDGGEWVHPLWLYMELAGHSPTRDDEAMTQPAAAVLVDVLRNDVDPDGEARASGQASSCGWSTPGRGASSPTRTRRSAATCGSRRARTRSSGCPSR